MEQVKFSEKVIAKLSRDVERYWQAGKCDSSEKGAVEARDLKDQVQSKLELGTEILEWRICGLPCKAGFRHMGIRVKAGSPVQSSGAGELMGCPQC